MARMLAVVVAKVTPPQSMCNLTLFWAGWQKIVAQIRGVFRKTNITTPLGGQNLGLKAGLHNKFYLHTVTTGSRPEMPFGYFLLPFHVLIEIYLLVPFPPPVCEGFSDFTRTSLRWGPVTLATTCMAPYVPH